MSKLHPRSFAFFLEQITQTDRLRWYFIGAASGLVLFVFWGTAQFQSVGLLVAAFVTVNLAFSFAYQRIRRSTGNREENFGVLKRVACAQVFVELLMITLSIHFSGGATSPFPLLYILYIGSISMFLPAKLLILLDTLAIVLYAGLLQFYRMGVLHPITPWMLQNISVNDTFLRNMEITYVTAMIVNGLVIFMYAERVQRGWQEADAQSNYLDRLNGLTKLGLEYHKTDNLYQILVNEIHELLEADNIYISRWDEKFEQIFSAAASGELNEAYLALPPTLMDQASLTQSVRRAGRSLVAEDVFCSPYMSRKIALQFPTRSLVGIPLYGLPDRNFLGALMVGYNTPHYFDPEEIERARQAADVAALLVSRTRLYEETLHRADLLEQLASQVTSITSDLRQTKLLPAVVEVASRLLHAPRAALHLYDPQSKEMRCECAIGLSDDYLKQITRRFNQIPGAQVLKDKAFVLVPDVHLDSRTSPIQDLIAYEKFRAYAVFALPSPEGSLGALSLYWDEPYLVTAEEISVAELFAQRAGALLYSARLFKQASDESLTDALTGLPNRRALDERLREENQRSSRYGRPYALLMIDLDGFKVINDTYGHPIGDAVLQQITGVLRRTVRSTDFVSRYGGDEFAIILPESGLDKASYVADKLKSTLSSTYLDLPDHPEYYISGCIGIAVSPGDASGYEDLLSIADRRLYDAKRTGTGTIVVKS